MAKSMNIRSSYRRLTTRPIWLVVAYAARWLGDSRLCSSTACCRSILWWHVLSALDLSDMTQIFVRGSLMPRVITCLLSGAVLALAGVIFQQVLRNPLAEPAPLGVSAGASLAIAATTVFAPQWLFAGQNAIAITGAAIAMIVVLALVWRQRLACIGSRQPGRHPVLRRDQLRTDTVQPRRAGFALYIWNAGSMNQNNWNAVQALAPRLVVGSLLAAALVRGRST